MPQSLISALNGQTEVVKRCHKRDLRDGYDGVFMPGALNRKWRTASRELIWQWFFPAKTLTLVPEANERRRYHLHETHV